MTNQANSDVWNTNKNFN